MDNICKDCKHNQVGKVSEMTTKDSSGLETPWTGLGEMCGITKCSMFDVQGCTAFEKKDKKE